MRRLSLDFGHAQRATRRRETAVVDHLDEVVEIVEVLHRSIVLQIGR